MPPHAVELHLASGLSQARSPACAKTRSSAATHSSIPPIQLSSVATEHQSSGQSRSATMCNVYSFGVRCGLNDDLSRGLCHNRGVRAKEKANRLKATRDESVYSSLWDHGSSGESHCKTRPRKIEEPHAEIVQSSLGASVVLSRRPSNFTLHSLQSCPGTLL